jgi:hypothetical protein
MLTTNRNTKVLCNVAWHPQMGDTKFLTWQSLGGSIPKAQGQSSTMSLPLHWIGQRKSEEQFTVSNQGLEMRVFYYLFIYLFGGAGFKLRDSILLGRHSTTLASPPRPSGLTFMSWGPGQQSSYLYFLCGWNDRFTPPCSIFRLRCKSCYLFAQAGL